MHLTDSAVHQQLFLDVLSGTKALVSICVSACGLSINCSFRLCVQFSCLFVLRGPPSCTYLRFIVFDSLR